VVGFSVYWIKLEFSISEGKRHAPLPLLSYVITILVMYINSAIYLCYCLCTYTLLPWCIRSDTQLENEVGGEEVVC